MTVATKSLRRDPAEVVPWAETCGQIRPLIEEQDLAASLRATGALVGHVHFADSNRQAVGFGHSMIAPVINALRKIGYKR